jgi:hypothetical protein
MTTESYLKISLSDSQGVQIVKQIKYHEDDIVFDVMRSVLQAHFPELRPFEDFALSPVLNGEDFVDPKRRFNYYAFPPNKLLHIRRRSISVRIRCLLDPVVNGKLTTIAPACCRCIKDDAPFSTDEQRNNERKQNPSHSSPPFHSSPVVMVRVPIVGTVQTAIDLIQIAPHFPARPKEPLEVKREKERERERERKKKKEREKKEKKNEKGEREKKKKDFLT